MPLASTPADPAAKRPAMLVCHCNVITEREIEDVVLVLPARRSLAIIVPAKVYHELGSAAAAAAASRMWWTLSSASPKTITSRWRESRRALIADSGRLERLEAHGSIGGTIVKGEAQVIERLNEALFLELGAVNQYWVHYRLLDDWGFTEARRQGARRVDRGDASRRQADRAHHLPRRPSQPAARRAAPHRPEHQGSARSRPRRRVRRPHRLQGVARDSATSSATTSARNCSTNCSRTRKATSTSSKPSCSCCNSIGIERYGLSSTRSRPTRPK